MDFSEIDMEEFYIEDFEDYLDSENKEEDDDEDEERLKSIASLLGD